jgi:hypothetical protein
VIKIYIGKMSNNVDKRIVSNKNNKNNEIQMKHSIEDIENPSLLF